MGPPMGPDGKPIQGPMMMGPNGPVPMPPPDHPIMMEMRSLDQHLRHLSQQPPTPENQQKMREMQGRMRHLQQTIGPDGRPMVMGPGGPMGPRPGPPPNHPVMMEMAALDKHLRGLYQQPQNPEIHAQIQECQGRMRSLQ